MVERKKKKDTDSTESISSTVWEKKIDRIFEIHHGKFPQCNLLSLHE